MQLINQVYYFTRFLKKISVVCIAGVSHSAFARLLDRWWTNGFGSDIC